MRLDWQALLSDGLARARSAQIAARGSLAFWRPPRPECCSSATVLYDGPLPQPQAPRRYGLFLDMPGRSNDALRFASIVGRADALHSASSSLHAGEAAGPTCNGKFVNPITDVCWSCLFPAFGRRPQDLAERPAGYEQSGIAGCACADPLPRIGISVGFWEPARLADVTMKPWCFPNLGGIRIAPVFDIGQGYLAGPSMVGGRSQSTAKWHVHWYVYPLLYWMEILTDFVCFEQASSTSLISPKSIRSGRMTRSRRLSIRRRSSSPTRSRRRPARAIASRPRRISRSTSSSGAPAARASMYPLNGNIPASIGHVQSSRLALSRFAYKMHREALAWGTMGSRACARSI